VAGGGGLAEEAGVSSSNHAEKSLKGRCSADARRLVVRGGEQPRGSQEDEAMSDSNVATEQERRPPSMDEIVAQQRRRLEEARTTMQEAAKDPDNREVLDKGKGHEGGSCLRF
jgi:hypothetical protein